MTTYSTHSDLLALYASLDTLLGSLSEPAFSGSGVLNDLAINATFLGTSDLYYKIEIDAQATPDTFTWSESEDDITWTEKQAGVAITSEVQKLSSGVTITFGNTTGHTLDDTWLFTATASNSDVERAFAYDWLNDFLRATYTVPISSPSQSVILAEAHYALYLILKARNESEYISFQTGANSLLGCLVSEQLEESQRGGPASNTEDIQVEFSRGRRDADGVLLGRGTSNDGVRGSLDDF